MERFLILKKRRMIWVFVCFLTIGMIIGVGQVYATQYSGKFTGYAMGYWYNCCGHEITQGDFANHHYDYCPNDPAASWQNGTRITTLQAISLHDAAGYPYSRTIFYLEDVGDFECSMGNYWVDIYFGRYRRNGEQCACNNPEEHCYTNYSNSCNDATNFGVQTRSYTQP